MPSFYIKSPSDRRHAQKLWADYWVKESLKMAFKDIGWTESEIAKRADLGMLLFNGRPHRIKSRKKIVWLYNQPSYVDPNALKKYHVVYALSSKHATWLNKFNLKVRLLLSATDMKYKPSNVVPDYDILVMGNVTSERLLAVKELKNHCKIGIVGQGWDDVKDLWIDEYWDHNDYAGLFSRAKLTLYIHRADTLQWEHVAIRVLDIIASTNNLVLADSLGINRDYGLQLPLYEGPGQVVSLLQNDDIRLHIIERARQVIMDKHTFHHRAEQINEDFVRGHL